MVLRRHNFNPNTSEFIIKSFDHLERKIQIRKKIILDSTSSLDPKLVTKEVEGDQFVVDWLKKELAKSSMFLTLEDVDPEYIKAGLLLYRDELIQAQRVTNTSELENEIKEAERILSLELIDKAPITIYEKYKSITPQSTTSVDSVSELINEIDTLNNLAKHSLGCRIFDNNAKLLDDLRKSCKTEEEFIHRLATIGSIIDDIPYDDIKKLVSDQGITGSINLIEKLLEEKKVRYDQDAIHNLRKLRRLRNTKTPIHNGEAEAIGILKEFSIKYPIIPSEAGEQCVKLLLAAIKSLAKSLVNYESN